MNITIDKEDNLDELVSENSGRSQWFCLSDTDTKIAQLIENIAGST